MGREAGKVGREEFKRENIEVVGHYGTWYIIDERRILKYGMIYLLEHEEYGNDALSVAIDENNNVVMEDVSEGLDEVEAYLNAVSTTAQNLVNVFKVSIANQRKNGQPGAYPGRRR